MPYPMESSYTIDSAAVDFVALLVCYIGLFLASKTKEGRSAWLSLSRARARTRGMSLNRCGHDVIDESCTYLRESATVGAWISKRLAANRNQ